MKKFGYKKVEWFGWHLLDKHGQGGIVFPAHAPPHPPFCYIGILTPQTCMTKKQSQTVLAMCSLVPQDSNVIRRWSAQLLNSTDKFNFFTWRVNIWKVFPRYVRPTQTQNCIFRCGKFLKPMWNPALFPVLGMQFLMFTKDLELTVTASSWYFSSRN